MKIAFLHTSESHIKRFDKIMYQVDPDIKIRHYTNEQILQSALKDHTIDKEGFNNQIQLIQSHQFEDVICTCSTYGELCHDYNQVYRIDKPIVSWIISNYSNIGIAYTAVSTKSPSTRLIEQVAIEQNKSISIQSIDCSHCWKYFEQGDLDRYAIEIANHIKRKHTHNCEVVFLTQASMSNAELYLSTEHFHTVSSPKYGVKEIINQIKKNHA